MHFKIFHQHESNILGIKNLDTTKINNERNMTNINYAAIRRTKTNTQLKLERREVPCT